MTLNNGMREIYFLLFLFILYFIYEWYIRENSRVKQIVNHK